MANIFEEKDPRGVKVVCRSSEWDGHIILNHEIMAGNEEAVRETIVSPHAIYESTHSDPPMHYREVYVKETPCASYYSLGLRFTKVVVATLGGSGEVITAFPSKSPGGGTIGECLYHD